MISSSFNCIPGLPILHSKDLINWKIVNHAIKERLPFESYELPAHAKGVWAPSIRYHDGKFWIFFATPDEGIFMTSTNDAFGDWSPLVHVKETKGWIDPCPFWDEGGQAYLAVAIAGNIFSPAGGVAGGWQTILRSKNVYGPYEDKIVLHQGNTDINGPHQGGWIELESGESWFHHSQGTAVSYI